MIKLLLVRAGCEVNTATSGPEGLKLAQNAEHDLITLDIDLHDEMNGFEICARLKQDLRLCQVPVVFISGRFDESDKRLGRKVGGADFITKPFPAAEFVSRILFHIKTARQQEQSK